MTEMVLIDAWSNCRITSAAMSQAMPMASQIHQSLETARAASRTSGVLRSGPPGVAGVAAMVPPWGPPRCPPTDTDVLLRRVPRVARRAGQAAGGSGGAGGGG